MATTGTSIATGSVVIVAVVALLSFNLKQPIVHRTSAVAEIQVIDPTTGRGVPLVELTTVNHVKYITDNAGRIAFDDAELFDTEVFFHVQSHGYEVPKDGFGYRGVKIIPSLKKPVRVEIQRINRAERLCRLTGQGLYRDTVLLGHPYPLKESKDPGRVAGQDTIQSAVYNNHIYCFWGDTLRMNYPLGMFRVAGATLPIFHEKSPLYDPTVGMPYEYFVEEKTGFARAMMPYPNEPEGVVWVEGVATVKDQDRERLIGHYTRRKGLAQELEQGIAVFNDDKKIFEPATQLPLMETWRKPSGTPIVHNMDGKEYLLFGWPVPNVRVPNDFQSILDCDKYEAYTCATAKGEPDTLPDGTLNYRWQSELPPITSEHEVRWLKQKKIRRDQLTQSPINTEDADEIVQLHRGSVWWNEHRKCWVLIATQFGGKSSHLGEVWYSEATEPTGPFRKAVKIVTHSRITFYNVRQQPWLQADGGKVIYFEGTYTKQFSGNDVSTPRYEYNQVLYRLDTSHDLLKPKE